MIFIKALPASSALEDAMHNATMQTVCILRMTVQGVC